MRSTTSCSSRPGSISLSIAFVISSSDSSWRAQSRLDSYSRAFSIATAAWEARSVTSSSSSAVKLPPPPFSVR
jgi:hypothetical protein